MLRTLAVFALLSGSLILAAGLTTARAQGEAVPGSASAPADPNKPAAGDKLVYVKMTTSKGAIVIELNETKAPISTANFLSYVDDGFYAGTIFHRVIPKFMIQGGGFTADAKQKDTKSSIKNEWQNGLKNKRGAIAMARTNVPDSATCQFFINVVDNAGLDQPSGGAAYAVFGRVVEGMDVVDAIKDVKTGVKNLKDERSGMPAQHRDWPVENVTIDKVERLPEGYKPAAG